MYGMYNLVLGKRERERKKKRKQPVVVSFEEKGKERKGKTGLNTTLFSLFYFFPFLSLS